MHSASRPCPACGRSAPGPTVTVALRPTPGPLIPTTPATSGRTVPTVAPTAPVIAARSVAGSFTVVATLPVALPAVIAALLLTGGCPAAGTPVPVVATL
ncbi:hypothetical protein ACIGO9_12270 [Nocardia asteroides]|uniref:hypothetical protein n=1 Tax=Nocardia asteroides TaxID=1824 RepID=UPI0037C7221F